MNFVEVTRGDSPVILGFPHTGTCFPPVYREDLNENGRLLADTDWHLHQLYAGLLPGATTVRATFHRYLIDANRDPAGTSLYPGQNTTGLVPLTDFDGQSIWREGHEPNAKRVADALTVLHGAYHGCLCAEIARVKARRGTAVLYDCHSIRSHIPFLFEGTLPDFNVGTDGGRTCAPAVQAAVVEAVREAAGYTSVVNGRFKGGWTTRHYGRPEDHVHAIQMELAQSTYLATEAPPFVYDTAKAAKVRVPLKTLLTRLETVAANL